MIDVIPDKKVVKINATIDDDINLILDAITKVEEAFVMLVLPEGNDLSNSPIGLKALRKKTLEKGKRMVLVMPKGSAYDLAKKAGFIASTSQDAVTGDVWQTVIQQFDEYKHTMAGMNSKKELPRHLENKVEYLAPVPEKEALPVPEIITGGGKRVNEEPSDEPESTHGARHIAPPTPPSSSSSRPEESNRMKMANQNVTGMDFSKLVRQAKPTSFFGRAKPPMSANTIVQPQEINSFHPDVMPKQVGAAIAKVSKQKTTNAFVRFLLFGLIGAIVAAVGIFIAYYFYFPRVRIELQVQSNALSLSDSVLATSAVTGFDVNKKEIQLTKEKLEKNASQSFNATEQGTDGVKATGTITVINSDPVSKTIPAGTLITSSGGKKFVSGTEVVIDVSGSVGVTATEFGEDYNLPASTTFTIAARPTLAGQNVAAFTGGSKRTFTVVGQKDIDKATKELQAELAKQGTSDLSYLNLDKGYEFIKESVKTEVKGKPTVAPAVGAEVKASDEDPTVTMYTNSTALYYHAESLTKLAEQLLLEKYKADKNLSADDAARTSIEQLTVKVEKVTIDKDDKVTLAFSASGLATYRLDAEKIRNDISGKKWPEMLEYLSALPTLARAPEVKFFPTWLPEFARYVPKEVSRIDVSLKIVVPEPTTTPTP